jgi:hypothetical protein
MIILKNNKPEIRFVNFNKDGFVTGVTKVVETNKDKFSIAINIILVVFLLFVSLLLIKYCCEMYSEITNLNL